MAAPEYVAYHDHEWGKPVRDDTAMLERLVLEGFQSGLSWSTVLRKRENFRKAFKGFDAKKVARFTDRDVERLMADAGIIRNRLKIDAAITNARALAALQEGRRVASRTGVDAPSNPRPRRIRTWADVPAQTDESKALAKALKKRGFTFVGPVTMYALMQACGLVDDHIAGCTVRRGGRGRATGGAPKGQRLGSAATKLLDVWPRRSPKSVSARRGGPRGLKLLADYL